MGLRSRAEGTCLPFQSKIDIQKNAVEDYNFRGYWDLKLASRAGKACHRPVSH